MDLDLPITNDYTGCDVILRELKDGNSALYPMTEEAARYFNMQLKGLSEYPNPIKIGGYFETDLDPIHILLEEIPDHYITGVLTKDGMFKRVTPEVN